MKSEPLKTTQGKGLFVDWKIKIATVGAWTCVGLGFLLAVPAVWRFSNDGFTLNNYAAFGSYLQGAVASFWSLGGLLLIYASFLAQQKQIGQQNRELDDQKEQFALQYKSMMHQEFESTFFQLLNLQNQIADAMRTTKTGKGMGETEVVKGRECFEKWMSELRMKCSVLPTAQRFLDNGTDPELQFTPIELAQNCYADFYDQHRPALGPYFKTLIHLLEFVRRSNIEDKNQYAQLVAAQMCAHELALFIYHGIYRGDPIRTLILEFGLLENLDKGLLARKDHLKFYYDASEPLPTPVAP